MPSKREKKNLEKLAWGGSPEKNKHHKPHRERLVRVDIMVGIAMILVVLGHFSVGFQPNWYSHGLHNWIYSFHMQLFVFLSAFLIRYTYKPVLNAAGYFKYIWRKFLKFFLPFLLIGITVALLACAFKGTQFSWTYMDHTLKTLLLYPRHSEVSFLWYIYILFGFYLISPLFFSLPQWTRVLCCVAAMFLPMLDAPHTLAAFDFSKYTFFYCLGVLCAEWLDEIRSAKPWLWALLSVPFLVWTLWVFTQGLSIGFEFPQLGWWLLVTGVSSLPFFYLLSLALEKTKFLTSILSSISRNSFVIYLLQMFIIWGSLHLLQTITTLNPYATTPQSSHIFTPFFIVTTILAIAIPILLSETAKHLITTKTKTKTLNPH